MSEFRNPSYIHIKGEDILLRVYVQPNASKNQIVGEHDGALKIKIKAVPEDGKANAELCAYIAKLLGLAKRDVEVISGHTSRSKMVLVRGADAQAVSRLHL